MSKGKVERIKKFLSNLIKSVPAEAPIGGKTYSQYISNMEFQNLSSLMKDLKDATENQLEEVMKELSISREKFESVKKMIEKSYDEKNIDQKMIAIIPVGGQGGSMFPLTTYIPKCLIIIWRKSILHYIIDTFVKYDDIFEKVIVLTNEFSEAVEENVRQGNYGSFV